MYGGTLNYPQESTWKTVTLIKNIGYVQDLITLTCMEINRSLFPKNKCIEMLDPEQKLYTNILPVWGSSAMMHLFCSDRIYYSHFVGIHIPWILSAFRGCIRILWILTAFCGYCGYIRISWIIFYWSYYELLSS